MLKRVLWVASLFGLGGVLIAVVLPYVRLPHCDAIESAAIGNLRALIGVLGRYHMANNSYPDAWLGDLYPHGAEAYGPLVFGYDLQGEEYVVQGYAYRFTPLPAGCAEPLCSDFALVARPHERLFKKNRAIRSFFVDSTGVIRHCFGGAGAGATDLSIDQAAMPCKRSIS